MRKHGIDFGRWRQWAEPDDPPKPIDFVIAGVTSGDHVNQMWDANRLPLRMRREEDEQTWLYHFYEPVNALSQLKAFMPCVDEVEPQVVAVDYEKLYTGQTLTKTDALVTKDIIQGLWKYFDNDKVMVYCGHDTWVNYLRKWDPDFFDQVELWLSWPNTAGENTVAFKPLYAKSMGRNFEDVRIFQYSWKGDAEAYGILNGPTDIDLNVYVNKQPFDEWLGITEQPEEPEEPGVDMAIEIIGLQDQLDEMRVNQETILEKLDSLQNATETILSKIDADGGTTTPPPVEPPVEPPAGETSAEIAQWQTKPKAEWPTVVGANNLRVAYVRPIDSKQPLYDGDDHNYETLELRAPHSDMNNTDSVRINIRDNAPVMVYADGPDYAHAVKGIRPYQLGGGYYFLVMHEQTHDFDNIKIWERVPGTQKLYLPVSMVEIIDLEK